MKFIGLDPSLTGTGIICLNEKGELEDEQLIKSPASMDIEDRLKTINNIIQTLLDKYQDKKHKLFINIEGLSYQSTGDSFTQLAGLHYFIRINLYKKFDLEYMIIAPKTLKKFVTGNGNSKKELMLLEVYKHWGVSFKDHNLADAYGLARMSYERTING